MKTAEAIAKIITETHGVGKNKEVGFGQNKYKARTIEDVLDMVRGKCGQYGLVFIPTTVKSTNWVDTRIGTSSKERKVQVCDVELEYIITTGEDSIQGACVGRGEDSGDKAPGKAMTYAYKALLVQTFMLATNDTDPDMEASEDNFVQNTKTQATKTTAKKPVAKPSSPREVLQQHLKEMPSDQRKLFMVEYKQVVGDKLISGMTDEEVATVQNMFNKKTGLIQEIEKEQ